MGTIRLVVDGPDRKSPVEVPVERLGEMLADAENRILARHQ